MRMSEQTRKIVVLAIIYLGFVSLGLPDTVLGVAWPEMRASFGMALAAAGILSSLTTICSVGSSLASGHVSARWGAGFILAGSGLLTCCAMFGYALSPWWALVVFFTLPLGIGQGAVDSALNAYVAKNYSSRQMSWLHCCWGIGATLAPLAMTAALRHGFSWRGGYLIIAVAQAAMTTFFFLTLKLWQRPNVADRNAPCAEQPTPSTAAGATATMHNENAKIFRASVAGCLFYFLYPGLETVAGLWGASFLRETRGIPAHETGVTIAVYWASLTVGRLFTGVLAGHLSNRNLIRSGLVLAASGACLIALPLGALSAKIGFTMMGLGFAPLYPCMMHDTPRRVGSDRADRVIGYQVGAGFAGGAIIPAAIGYILSQTSLTLLGPSIVAFAIAVIACHEVSAANGRSEV